MKVSFVLPGNGRNPIGGFKVVYEYANRLTARGHTVTVIHTPHGQRERSFLRTARHIVGFAGRGLGLKGGYKPNTWFQVDPRVQMKWVPSLHPRWVPDSDIVVAAAWGPSEWVSEYPKRKGRKFYLIQALESVFEGVDPVRVMGTWRLPLEKIVISKWLKDIANDLGECATYIPNGLSFEDFGLDVPLRNRNPQRAIMLYHEQNRKGSAQGLDAMRLVKRGVPQLEATLFGVPKKPKGLPGWISYWQKPNTSLLRRLYNEAAICIAPSLAEGWSLPPCEAAQCGVALCVTDIGGHREYSFHEETALLSPPNNPKALAANVRKLIEDDELRYRLAIGGHEYIQQFTWDRAVNVFERILRSSS